MDSTGRLGRGVIFEKKRKREKQKTREGVWRFEEKGIGMQKNYRHIFSVVVFSPFRVSTLILAKGPLQLVRRCFWPFGLLAPVSSVITGFEATA